MGELRIGTSGWSYPSGAGRWTGLFYPPAARRTGRFDELAYYAERFDTVEVNSTFYRLPDPEVVAGWARRTPPRFDFSVKLYQRFTHARGVAGPGASAQQPDAGENPIPAVSQTDVDDFRRAVEPIATAGKLGVLLAQFPPSFRKSLESVDHVAFLLAAFRDHPLAVELRHRSWSDDVEETLVLLNEHGAAFVQIDEPKFRFSIRQDRLHNTGGLYYMRLHGRNAAQWWRHKASEDRYNYLYTPDEIRPVAETASTVRSLVKKAYVYFNNHFSAKAVVNAVELRDKLGEPVPDDFEPEMLEAYGALREIVERRRRERAEKAARAAGGREPGEGSVPDGEADAAARPPAQAPRAGAHAKRAARTSDAGTTGRLWDDEAES